MFELIFYTLTQVSLMLSYEESELEEFDDEESETERLGAMTLIISETLLLYDKKYLQTKKILQSKKYNQESIVSKNVKYEYYIINCRKMWD
jgi:hypothetical protein